MKEENSKLVERFLKYVSIWTTSDDTTGRTPSTERQLDLARYLRDELMRLGLEDVSLDENGYVMATLPSNDERIPTIGFIAHMDTAPDASGEHVKARIVRAYDGKDIVLNEAENIVLETKAYPEILDYQGQDIIVTDGTTLLGADDKAGVAAIVSAMEYLIQHPEIKHGKIRVGFTPDEEIGEGPDHFDVAKFGADFAYTIDGGAIGELEYENFNAAKAKITFHGVNVHPGYGYKKMKNSQLIANRFMYLLPPDETPAHTQAYEGFFHLIGMQGSVEETVLNYIIRDHDREHFKARKASIEEMVAILNREYGEGTVEAEIKDQYYNMLEIMRDHEQVIDLAKEAMKAVGVTPKVQPIRGGTDGARLSFMNLPCPNIFTGGMNFHSRFEYLPIPSMEKAMEVVIQIAEMAK